MPFSPAAPGQGKSRSHCQSASKFVQDIQPVWNEAGAQNASALLFSNTYTLIGQTAAALSVILVFSGNRLGCLDGQQAISGWSTRVAESTKTSHRRDGPKNKRGSLRSLFISADKSPVGLPTSLV